MAGEGTRAVEAVRAAGVAHTLHEYELPERTGASAMPAPPTGWTPRPRWASHRSDCSRPWSRSWTAHRCWRWSRSPPSWTWARWRRRLGGRRAEIADPVQAEKLTGYQVGAISPLGTRRALPVMLDETAVLFDTVLCSAGRRGLQVELSPDDLIRLTNAQLADIGRAASLMLLGGYILSSIRRLGRVCSPARFPALPAPARPRNAATCGR